MFGLGTQELIIILVLVLMIFGAGKLPQVAGAMGRGIRELKEGLKGSAEEEESPPPSSPPPRISSEK